MARTVEELALELRETGAVEVRRSAWKVAAFVGAWWTFVVIGLLVLPHAGHRTVVLAIALVGVLAFAVVSTSQATGRGPALRLDAHGVRVGGWRPYDIAWRDLAEWSKQRRFLAVRVNPDVVARRRASLPPVLRALTAALHFGGPRDLVQVPPVLEAGPADLARWLTDEVAERRHLNQ